MKLKGILMKSNVPTLNGNLYPREVLEKSIQELKERIEKRKFFGGPPSRDRVIHLQEVSHLVTDMSLDDKNNLNVELEVLNTPNGQVLKDMIKNGPVSFGLCGYGSIIRVDLCKSIWYKRLWAWFVRFLGWKNYGYAKEVQNDYVLRSVDVTPSKPVNGQSVKEA